MQKIFVYGSLREGMYNYDKYLKGNSIFLGYGYVKGSLYSLKGVSYPAILEGKENILGEVYEIDDELLKEIDALEEYVPGDPNNDYNRILTTIYMQDGTTVLLPVYFFNLTKKQNFEQIDQIINENDYVAYMNL